MLFYIPFKYLRYIKGFKINFCTTFLKIAYCAPLALTFRHLRPSRSFLLVFDCCKQSLIQLYYPPSHPSRTILLCTKKERLGIYCIDLLLFCANHKTGEDRFFCSQNFNFKLYNALECSSDVPNITIL